jgi:hypothetical protein
MPDNAILLAEAIVLTAWLDAEGRQKITPLLKEVLDGRITINELRLACSTKRLIDSHKLTPQATDTPLS